MSEKLYNYLYNYLYKVTNTISGKYYIGIHSTNNINDGYMGSGHALVRAQKKYGIDKFQKVIIEECIDRQTLFKQERELVNDETIKDPMCYNIQTGGRGHCGVGSLAIKCHINGKDYPSKAAAADDNGVSTDVIGLMLKYGYDDYELYRKWVLWNHGKSSRGKKLTKDHRAKLGHQNKKSCIIYGIKYDSIKSASKHTGHADKTILRLIKDPTYKPKKSNIN